MKDMKICCQQDYGWAKQNWMDKFCSDFKKAVHRRWKYIHGAVRYVGPEKYSERMKQTFKVMREAVPFLIMPVVLCLIICTVSCLCRKTDFKKCGLKDFYLGSPQDQQFTNTCMGLQCTLKSKIENLEDKCETYVKPMQTTWSMLCKLNQYSLHKQKKKMRQILKTFSSHILATTGEV